MGRAPTRRASSSFLVTQGKQTAQHMDAVHMIGLMHEGRLVVAQNKVDLVTPVRA